MTSLEDKIREFTIAHLTQRAAALGIDATIGEDFLLMESGLIDSMGFVELISTVEAEFGFQLDFADMDPQKLASVRSFVAVMTARKSLTDS